MSDKEFLDRAILGFASLTDETMGTFCYTRDEVINASKMLLADRNKALEELKLND